MTVFLIGFMGSGKTTVGRKLAAKMGYEFIDLDHAVEKADGSYIRDIIEAKGEPYFREIEANTLRQLELTDKVISTGGGTPCFHNSMTWMNAHGVTVYIKLSEAALYSRLKTTNMEHRPLLKGLDEEGLLDFIRNKLAEREPFYMQADILLDKMDTPMQNIIDQILMISK